MAYLGQAFMLDFGELFVQMFGLSLYLISQHLDLGPQITDLGLAMAHSFLVVLHASFHVGVSYVFQAHFSGNFADLIFKEAKFL